MAKSAVREGRSHSPLWRDVHDHVLEAFALFRAEHPRVLSSSFFCEEGEP